MSGAYPRNPPAAGYSGAKEVDNPADEDEDAEAGDRNQSCFKCTNKGNIFVCCECNVDEDDLFLPFATEKTKLRWVVGPYWNMLCMTYAVVLTITFLVYQTVIPRREQVEIVVGLTLSALTLLFLSLTAFSDPGIFPKHTRPRGPNWSYSGQAQSFRPARVIYCRECKLLIEDYDHFCPWSGTVIGGKNLKFFHCFVSCLVLTMMYDAVLLIFALADQNEDDDRVASTTTDDDYTSGIPSLFSLFSRHI